MCNMSDYGYSDVIITGSFENDLNIIDMNPTLDCYLREKKFRNRIGISSINKYFSKHFESSNLNINSKSNSFCSSKLLYVENQSSLKLDKNVVESSSMGLIAQHRKLRDVLTSVAVDPTSAYFVCGTLGNTVQIVGCGSSPMQEDPIITDEPKNQQMPNRQSSVSPSAN